MYVCVCCAFVFLCVCERVYARVCVCLCAQSRLCGGFNNSVALKIMYFT